MAEQKTFHVTVAHVDGALFDGDAHSMTVPGLEGEMTILANHSALVSPLQKGIITVRTHDTEEVFSIEKGTLEVRANSATVLL